MTEKKSNGNFCYKPLFQRILDKNEVLILIWLYRAKQDYEFRQLIGRDINGVDDDFKTRWQSTYDKSRPALCNKELSKFTKLSEGTVRKNTASLIKRNMISEMDYNNWPSAPKGIKKLYQITNIGEVEMRGNPPLLLDNLSDDDKIKIMENLVHGRGPFKSLSEDERMKMLFPDELMYPIAEWPYLKGHAKSRGRKQKKRKRGRPAQPDDGKPLGQY